MPIGADRVGDYFLGRVAIVTGGTSGIGRATVIRLASRGAHVVAVARDAARIAILVDEMRRAGPGTVTGVPADVTHEAAMAAAATQTICDFGRIDILVCAAGIGRSPADKGVISRPVAQLTCADWHAVLDTNLKGTFLANRAVLPFMIAQRHGDIVNISSARGATRGQAFAAPYCASKYGVVGLSEALRDEVACDGVRVQVLLPDVTRTPLLERTTVTARLGPLLPVDRVAETIIMILALPRDAICYGPLVAPASARYLRRSR